MSLADLLDESHLVVRALQRPSMTARDKALVRRWMRALAVALLAPTRVGRPPRRATTPDGRLVQRACRRLDLSMTALARRLGTHKSVLSRALHARLPTKHRAAIRSLLRSNVR